MVDSHGDGVCVLDIDTDAPYIAAVDPQTVLGLLDALDVAVEELGRSNDLCRDTACCRSTAAALARIRELTEGENDGN